MKIAADGDVGIGTGSPAAKLDVNGTIRSRDGGYEFPDGSVQGTAVFAGTQHYTVGPGSFVSQNSASPVVNNALNGVWMDDVTSRSILAPIHLPDGARISGYTAYLHDTAAADLQMRIIRKIAGGSAFALALGLEIPSPPAGDSSATKVGNHQVNNAGGAYYLEVFPMNGDDWPGDSTLRLDHVVIEWSFD